MKVRLQSIVQDPLTAQQEELRAIEGTDVEDDEQFFLDGPIGRQVAVVDLDDRTGALMPGAVFQPPPPGRKLGRYAIADETDLRARDLNQVSVYTTVLGTMEMYQEPDALGRPLSWAFGAAQLLVVPRAGERARAFYQRESHSLQFFFFPSQNPANRGQMIFSSLSRDIVAHETAHAILDGIAPDLYHALTPQSLALHEAVADLTAALMAFRSRVLREAVLNKTGGSISDSTPFSSVAEEFARSQDRFDRVGSLRSLANDKTLDPGDQSKDALGKPNLVSRRSPHQLSQVLTGALYPLIVDLHDQQRRKLVRKTGGDPLSVSGRALAIAADRFKRMLLRALDYLPPGEVSFADYGRAILASDQASHPVDDGSRAWIRKELRRRHIVEDEADLEVRTLFDYPGVSDLDLDTLVASDWAAYDFADRNRQLLGIPSGVHFRVRPRLDASKLYFHTGGRETVRECIFKVSWDHREDNVSAGRANGARRLAGMAARRQITVGTTLVIDWQTRRVRALLTSDQSGRQRQDRDEMLAGLLDAGELRPDASAAGVLGLETSGDLMRLRRAATLLHLDAAPATAPRQAPERRPSGRPPRVRPVPPSGVDAGAFYNLIRWRERLRFGGQAPPLSS